MLKLELGFWG
jgi:hypothetical protein